MKLNKEKLKSLPKAKKNLQIISNLPLLALVSGKVSMQNLDVFNHTRDTTEM